MKKGRKISGGRYKKSGKKKFYGLPGQARIVKLGEKKRELKPGTFNALIESLLEWDLIGVEYKKGSKKEKEYYITPDGEFTLNFIKIEHNS